jgi:hypothetical protein
MSENEQARSEAPDTEDDTIRDLEVPENESDDVKGGTIFAKYPEKD